MTYEDLVYKVRRVFENADARKVLEHVAIQVNITGEGEGIFYVEVAERHICVEPYDYYDRDCLLIIPSAVVVDLCEKKYSLKSSIESGLVQFYGDQRKMNLCLSKIKLR
ncbi:MAG: SCP2 sterol-binding domain-containing protein [Lachnospiraceae bacterium]|nr:SCP2 sterol-binding domain-containing protein [Lachnospiraceae bacterium]MBQ2101900.1 SCP2 sterol-binding domain-containing protein [Lachnospiraceae bacterium]MBQ3905733.1 SCP2 sterol-binding domain-containing protein [Lachnospiraceae bacterium]